MTLGRGEIEREEEIFGGAGYREMTVPLSEDTGLFARTSGEGSDVVTKEMYSFTDRGDRAISLRPELTAGLVRAYLQHGMATLPQVFVGSVLIGGYEEVAVAAEAGMLEDLLID